MIEFIDVCKTDPYQHFIKLYNEAKNHSQEHIEAAAVSTASHDNKPSSRFVNIKYVHNESFIFFSITLNLFDERINSLNLFTS